MCFHNYSSFWLFFACHLLILPFTQQHVYFNNVPHVEVQLTAEDFERSRYTTDTGQLVDVTPYRNDLFEGDISTPGLSAQSVEEFVTGKRGNAVPGAFYNAIRNKYGLWPNGQVPYVISSQYSSYSRAQIAAAIREYNEKTCIKFVPRDPQTHGAYLSIKPEDGCYSTIGREGGQQVVSLGTGCIQKGVIMHELLHALGFFHEQSRPDRDLYVDINWHNIQPSMKGQFDKYTVKVIDDLGVQYDYGSIMHYGPFAFSANGERTVEPKQVGAIIGQRQRLSVLDLYKLNLLYVCEQATESPQPIVPVPTEAPPLPQPLPTSAPCVDQRLDCVLLQSQCTATLWVEEQCPATCNKCEIRPNQGGGAGGINENKENSCVDVIPGCSEYQLMGYCHLYADWMKSQCSWTCGLCDAGSISSGCKDQHSNCAYYNTLGYCQTYSDYMHKQCPAACGVCGKIGQTGETCSDQDQGTGVCTSHAANGMCVNSRRYMEEFCPVTCGFCVPNENDINANFAVTVVTPAPLYTPTQAPDPSCVDLLSAADCYRLTVDRSNACPADVSRYCPRSCGTCGMNNNNNNHQPKNNNNNNNTNNSCVDVSTQCAAVLAIAPVTCQSPIVREHCQRTCGIC